MMTDEEILKALRGDDAGALQAVYRQYREPCLRFLLARVIDQQIPDRQGLAVELFTESLIVLTQNVRSGRLTELTARLDTYLNAVARNLYRKLRRRGREEYRDPNELPQRLVDPHEEEPTDDPAGSEERKLLYARMRELGPRCRQLLVHFYFLELDWNTVADMLGYKNAASAKTNKAKCMARLRALYGLGQPK